MLVRLVRRPNGSMMIRGVATVADTEHGVGAPSAGLPGGGSAVGERGRLSTADDERQVGHKGHHVTAFQLRRLSPPC